MSVTDPANHHVVVLGASPKPERYSNQCIRLLQEQGYRITPVNPAIPVIEGIDVTHQIGDIGQPVHTLTMYVGEARSSKMLQDILDMKPERVIFNPGSESDELRHRLNGQGAECINGCTLVMLRTGQF